MKTFYSLKDFLKSQPASKKFAVTIGVFDGLHRGHRKLIGRLMREARKGGLSTLLITFDPHPANMVKPSVKVPLLVSLKHRLKLLERMGIDCVIVLRFTKRIARMRAGDFIRSVLARARVKKIVIGDNFFFGKDKKGSLEELGKFAHVYGYKIKAVKTVKKHGLPVSSTRIRNLILKGRLKQAEKLLMSPVTVLGTVKEGRKVARTIGFPTANIDPHHEAIPPSGVYAVMVRLENRLCGGILNIGFRPTFAKTCGWEKDPSIEVHIFGLKRHIYGKDLEIMFVARIRPEKKFSTAERLKKQIEKDVERVKRTLHDRNIIYKTAYL